MNCGRLPIITLTYNMTFMNQQKKCSELFVPYMKINCKINYPVKDPFSPAFQSFPFISLTKCGLQLNPNSRKTFITLRYDTFGSSVQRHSRTQSPSYARLATRGSGEIQIVKASDWLQEIVKFSINNVCFT